jgi:predicted small lipoprotein YifL
MKSLVRLFTALLALVGVTSCGGAAPDWQALELPGAGAVRVRHSHRITAADKAGALGTAQTLLDWTRTNAWDRVRVRVDGSHPIVTRIKAGDVLVLTPEDASLPVIWISLGREIQALLEDRATGALSLFDLPPGKSLNLSWLGL